jgi:hypothetical protein
MKNRNCLIQTQICHLGYFRKKYKLYILHFAFFNPNPWPSLSNKVMGHGFPLRHITASVTIWYTREWARICVIRYDGSFSLTPRVSAVTVMQGWLDGLFMGCCSYLTSHYYPVTVAFRPLYQISSEPFMLFNIV